jgi:FkbM family methyltransferase
MFSVHSAQKSKTLRRLIVIKFDQIIQFASALRRAFLILSKPQRSYSQCAEDLIARMFLKVPPLSVPGFYVDVGCHHLKTRSHTYGFYKSGWSGILIDMEEDKVVAAKMARKRDGVVRAAIRDRSETLNIYSPEKFSTNATIDLEAVAHNPEYRRTSRITAETLTEVLKRHSYPSRLKFLNIDCEGNDFRVIKGLDLVRYTPRVLCIKIWF